MRLNRFGIWAVTQMVLLVGFSGGPLEAQTSIGGGAIRCRNLFLDELNSYQKFVNLSIFNREQELGRKLPPSVDRSFGTSVPIVRSLEKEGLYYEEIAEWFPSLKTESKQKLLLRFEQEEQPETSPLLKDWLSKIRLSAPQLAQQLWEKSSPRQRLELLLQKEDPFEWLSVADRSYLFDKDILNFNDIVAGPKAPPLVTVGDDLGSYEVRLSRGVIDRVQFHQLRDQVEEYLEGKIGHQHLFHAWPSEMGLRQEIAPYYIELLDSTTWYLFWRQIKRNPEEVDSVVAHPFLGVYTRQSLDHLKSAMVSDDPQKFRDKYRMVGARNFTASAAIPEQGTGLVPDWEIRSGNKGVKREFVENLLISRLSTGDYSGLRPFDSYDFNPSASIRKLLLPLQKLGLKRSEIDDIEKLQETHPLMTWSKHASAKNHFRNRIISPLLPWYHRLNLDFKKEALLAAQVDFARGLARVARSYERAIAKQQKSTLEARSEALATIEKLTSEFAQKVRLDLDFERYLEPRPSLVPSIQIERVQGPVDVNALPLGIEYSFRMPFEADPQSRAEAESHILGFAERFAQSEGQKGAVESLAGDGHGHGVAVKFKVNDRFKQSWRFEWDGIQRNYDENGKITNAWGGHIEVVTPKFSPESIQGSIEGLYAESRKRGLQPRRSAGGAHVNFDLTTLEKNFSPREGTRRVINLISYFESNEPLILFLWQHPKRRHAAYPVKVSEDGARRLFEFEGDWKQLGKLLYEIRYFNTYVGRKPKYVPLNLTSLMTPVVPDSYIEASLDIRNAKQKWFPNFNKVTGRGEARFFDAPVDESMAALQIKYFRALLNKGFNSDQKILLVRRFNDSDVSLWTSNVEEWIKAVNLHLQELGLNPEEFRSLIWDSWMNQKNNEASPRKLETYDSFLPPKD